MKFNRADFNQFVLDNGVIGFFEQAITLKSGRISNWYLNWRNVTCDVFLTDALTDYIVEFCDDLIKENKLESPDCFYGVPEGATKLGILTQYKWARKSENYSKNSHPFPMGRAKPKEHGDPKDRFFVGVPTGKTIVIEDTTTTGGSLLTSLDKLIESDIEVIAAVGLTNRAEKRDDGLSVKEAVAQRKSKGKSIPYYNLTSALDLLPTALKREENTKFTTEIIEYFNKYGIEKINL